MKKIMALVLVLMMATAAVAGDSGSIAEKPSTATGDTIQITCKYNGFVKPPLWQRIVTFGFVDSIPVSGNCYFKISANSPYATVSGARVQWGLTGNLAAKKWKSFGVESIEDSCTYPDGVLVVSFNDGKISTN